MSTSFKLIVVTTRSGVLNAAATHCYNFVSGLSDGNRTRRPLRASSSMHRRPLVSAAAMSFSCASLLLSEEEAISSTTWNSMAMSSVLSGLPSMSSVCVSVVFIPNSSTSSDVTIRRLPLKSAASCSTFPIAGHMTTSGTFCHKTLRKFFRLTSFCRFRDGSARESMKSFFRRDDRVELLMDFCRSRFSFSSPGEIVSSVGGHVSACNFRFS
jgi:hypothetical protein